MATVFNELVFENLTGIDVDVSVEAPIGIRINTYQVPASTSKTFRPGVIDTPSVSMTAHDGTHTTTQSFDLTASGNPTGCLIETIKVHYNVGSMRGAVQATF